MKRMALLLFCASGALANISTAAAIVAESFFRLPKSMAFEYAERSGDADAGHRSLAVDFSSGEYVLKSFGGKGRPEGEGAEPSFAASWTGGEFRTLSITHLPLRKVMRAVRRSQPSEAPFPTRIYYALNGKDLLSAVYARKVVETEIFELEKGELEHDLTFEERGSIVKMRVNEKTKLPSMITLLWRDKSAEDGVRVFSRTRLENYIEKDGCSMPTKITAEYYPAGRPVRVEFEIIPESVVFGAEMEGPVTFPEGCMVSDEIDGNNYIVPAVKD